MGRISLLVDVIYDLLFRYFNETIKERRKLRKSKLNSETLLKYQLQLQIFQIVFYGRIYFYSTYLIDYENDYSRFFSVSLVCCLRALFKSIDEYFELETSNVLTQVLSEKPDFEQRYCQEYEGGAIEGKILRSYQEPMNNQIEHLDGYNLFEILREFGIITPLRCMCYLVL